jgi:hypothetical protein
MFLNKGFRKKTKYLEEPFVNVEGINSKNSDLMQINDIILGSIGYIKNGFTLIEGSKKAKVELSEYILANAGLINYNESTPFYQERFAIWNFKLKQ